ncbi:MAG: hypothetical protein KKG99_06375 [Bacteroidetes bacterium]|nr:hypothetical protein [Bacteroidota bacterium]
MIIVSVYGDAQQETKKFVDENKSKKNIIFLHHSIGEQVYYTGLVAEWINDYNVKNNTEINLTERKFPTKPYAWNNYPYDFWNLWVTENKPGIIRKAACDSSNINIECLDTLAINFDVIIFKHCYPGSDVEADTGNPDVSSNIKSIENYKLQYRALRRQFEKYPDTLFILWTLAPRHRLRTTQEHAARAKLFVDWVNNEFLSEGDTDHLNIYIFDFWGLVAEKNVSSRQVNTLKYEYERSHTDKDSHPNDLANEKVGPLFAKFIVDSVFKFKKIRH